MHFSTLFTASSLALTTLAHPYSPASGNTFEAQLLKRQDAGTVITSGANGLGDGNTHARLEVSDLAANHPYQWALYILTMAKWEQTAQTDATGYFGISSIHGVPRTSWDGVEACDSCDGADGYCTHDSVLFPAWHRAYLALYEQEFLNAATEVANGLAAGAFKDSVVNGLATLRIPYWDWAANPDGANTLPTIISSPQITIAGPDGQQTVDNPLYSYAFTDASGMYYSPFTNWDNTLRYPNSNANGATSQEQQAVDAFNNVRENVQDQIYSLLTQCDDYLHFATDDASSSAPSCANSLEGIHNTIHTAAGGAGSKDVSGGHMTYLPLASFDPIFWLHHANVDRIFALWQTVHPDVYGASQTAPHNTWTIASGSEQNADSPLKPFRKDANTWWTTNDVKDWAATFKYTYPEFEDSDGSSSAIINYINKLYGQNPTLTAGSVSKNVEKNGSGAQSSSTSSAVPTTSVEARDRSPSTTASTSTAQGYGIGIGLGPISLSIGLPFGPGNAAPTATASNGFPQLGGFGSGAWNGTATRTGPSPTGTGSSSGPGNTEVDPTFLAPNGSMYQYQCNIHTPRYAFDGSYSIYVFDGQPSNNDSSNWLGDKNCVGTIGVLAGGEMANKDLLISGSVPITRHLQRQYKAGKLDGMAETYVVPYMAKNLNWKIVYNGEEVHPNALSGFKSSFFSGTSSLAGDGILPKWSSLIPEIDVTLGKAGGVQQIADAIGDTIGDVTSAIGGLLPTGYGSSPASTDSPEYAPSATKPSTEAPEVTEAPASPAAPEEYEETVTILTTVYTTVCPCKASATAPAY